MKPAAFDYVRARTLDEALAALENSQGDAKILAGGQSLVPLMNFRMVAPDVLVDINNIASLDYIAEEDDCIRVGALTRHHALETSELVKRELPVISAAMQRVAHIAVRNRGTIGGSLSHADPATELPMLSFLLDADVSLVRLGHERTLPVRDFIQGPLTTAIEQTELLREIRFPKLVDGMGWGFEEVSRRSGDYAVVAVASLLQIEAGKIVTARLCATGVDDRPVRGTAAEDLLLNGVPNAELIEQAAQLMRDAANPSSDLHASSDYRRHLLGVLTLKALMQAWQRAEV